MQPEVFTMSSAAVCCLQAARELLALTQDVCLIYPGSGPQITLTGTCVCYAPVRKVQACSIVASTLQRPWILQW